MVLSLLYWRRPLLYQRVITGQNDALQSHGRYVLFSIPLVY